MSGQPTITLSREMVRQLAFDVANDFFTEEELCTRYDLTLGQVKYIKGQNSFHKHVLDLKHQLKDDGKELLLQAREYVADILRMYKEIADDPDNSTAARMKAGDAIMELARVKVAPQAGMNLPGGGGGNLILYTNLAVEEDSLDGEYKLVAKGPERRQKPEAIEAEYAEIEDDNPASEFL